MTHSYAPVEGSPGFFEVTGPLRPSGQILEGEDFAQNLCIRLDGGQVDPPPEGSVVFMVDLTANWTPAPPEGT